MKVTITGDKPQVQEIDWTKPCLVKFKSNELIVYSHGQTSSREFGGIVLSNNGYTAYANGHYSNGWSIQAFELLPEDVEITLSNKSE